MNQAPTVKLIPEESLAPFLPDVEVAARERRLAREDLLADPRQRTTVLYYVLLTWLADRLTDWPAETVYWTRFYWHHRLGRMHALLEHDGQPCPNGIETEIPLLDAGCGLDVNWDHMEPLKTQANADAEAALGPGPFQRPPFACGDIRPITDAADQ